MWQLGLIISEPEHALSLEFEGLQPELSEMTEFEDLAAEYRIQGLSQRRHPMELYRKSLVNKAILRGSELKGLPSGRRVSVAGSVVCRQKPGTAGGHVFLTLEDEEGLINVVLRPKVYEKYRSTARMEPLLVVEGLLQRKDGVINIVAERLYSLSRVLGQTDQEIPAPRSRDFC